MTWSATQYTTFETQRTRPVRDLVAGIPAVEVRHAVDLGCGPGNSTEVLLERYPDALVTGFDNSDDMLASARKRLPGVTFEHADIGQWACDTPLDVILANASLQWLPDHERLYPRLLDQLASGGTLAIQTPDNEQEPAHVLMRKVAGEGAWAARLAEVRTLTRHSAPWYYDMLRPHCRALDVWRTIYFHPLADAAAIVEWFKGSALRPYLDALDGAERVQFLERYRDEVASAYPALSDGTVLLPFPRLFIVAVK